MTHKMSKKIVSIVSIILLFIVSFTLLGGTEKSFESIKKGVLELFAKNEDGSPLRSKTLTDNGDGTYKISLNVTGESEKQYNHANVIVVFDTSGSMRFCTDPNGATDRNGYCVNTNANRLAAAKSAVNNLANSLLSKNTTEHPNVIEMALVQFATTASIRQTKTSSYSTFSSTVNNLSANGGTNWEAALQKVLDVDFGDNDQTYVIFVSDGNPTFRTTRNGHNDQYQTGVYGTGQETTQNINRCYETATDDAEAIVDEGYEFFTIGAYGNVDRMKSLTTASGAGEDNYYSAANTSELQAALDDILAKIERAGFGSVSVVDGTTKQVKATSGDLVNQDMLVVDESTYKYTLTIPVTGNGPYTYDKYTLTVNGNNVNITWKDSSNNNKSATYPGRKSGNDIILDWSDTTPTDFYKVAPKGELKDGAVEWDLENLGVLLNDVTYTISFDVYPAQVTLDLIADFKNKPALYDDLPDTDPVKKNIKKEVLPNGDIEYKLRTNTNATLTYTDTRTDDGSQTKPYVNPEPVSTVSAEMMAISKDYKDYLGGTKPEITLYIDRDSESGHYDVLLKESNNYTATRYISVGIMVVDENAGTVSVKTPGHDYKFSEDTETAHNWELEGDVSHPMLINNQPTMLVKVEKPNGMTKDYQEIGGIKYYKIGNSYYKATAAESASLTATNYRRGYMDVNKVVEGADAPKNAEFTYEATWTTGDGKEFWFSIYDSSTNTYIRNTESKTYVSGPVTESVREKDGVEEVYYYAASGSTVSITVQAGWGLRFLNLPVGSTYSISEPTDKMPQNFSFKKVEGTKKEYTETNNNPSEVPFGTPSGTGISGTIDTNNTKYYVTFTNDYTKTHIDLTKIWKDNSDQDGIRPDSVKVYVVGEIETENGMQVVVPKKEYIISKPETTEGTTTDGDTTEAIDPNKWTVTYNGLDRLYQGKEIVYRIVEEEEVDGYNTENSAENPQPLINKTTITNYHTPEVIDITVKKAWQDDNNRDDVRPTSVQVQLYAGKSSQGGEITLDKDNNWSYTYEGLPAYADGEEIIYSVKELGTEIDEETKVETILGSDNESIYVVTISGDKDKGFTVTNKHENDTTEVTVTKDWQDDNNRDGVRPASVRVQVFDEEGKAVGEPYTLTQADNWTHTFTGLIKNKNGKAIEYTVKELGTEIDEETKVETILGSDNESIYVVTISGDKDKGFTVTNKHENDTTEVTVTKDWQDENNRDGVRPASVRVQVYNGEEAVGEPYTLTQADNWTHTFTGLIKNKNGKAIEYTVKELDTQENVEGKEVILGTDNKSEYVVTISGDKENGYKITNTHTPNMIEVTVVKDWQDDNDRDDVRPEELKVTLYNENDNSIAGETTLKADATGTWSHTFTVPKYEAGKQGVLINYNADEYEVPEGYIHDKKENTIETDEDGNCTITIHNKHENDTIDVKVTKKWADGENRDNSRPDSIEVQLYAGSTNNPVGQPATLDKDHNWTYTFEGLTKNEAGQPIRYIVKEVGVTADDEGNETINFVKGEKSFTYTVTTSGDMTDGYTITNTYTPEVTSVKVTKDWQDGNNQDGSRPDPENVSVELVYENGESTGQVVVLSESNQWTQSFTNLPKNADGQEIVYKVREMGTEIDDEGNETLTVSKNGKTYVYTVTTEGNQTEGYKIVNSYTPEITELKIEKVWVDDDDRDDLRPDDITVKLGADQEIEEKGQTITLSPNLVDPETKNWIGSFTNLPKYHNGVEINYSVAEIDVDTDNYSVDISEIVDGKITITNTHNIATVDIPVEKIWQDGNNQDDSRPDSITIVLYAGEGENKQEVRSQEIFKEDFAIDENWSYIFKGLPKNDKGQEIKYTVGEKGTVTDDNGVETLTVFRNGQTFVYTVTVKGNIIYNSSNLTIPINGVKTWIDDNDRDGARPDTITINLYADGEKIDSKVVDAFGDGKYDFGERPKYKEGQPILYVISEEAVDGYSTVVEGYDITNTHELETVNIVGTKVWNDDDDRDSLRPENVTIILYAGEGENKKEVDSVPAQKVVTEDEDGNEVITWKFEFKNKLKYENKKEIAYTVGDNVDGYEFELDDPEIDEENNTITFELINNHTPETIEFNITKNWDDYEDEDGARPDSITVYLYADGELIDTIIMNSENGWKYSTGELKRYRKTANGEKEEIEYTIVEKEIEGYGSRIDTTIIENDNNKDGKVINNSITNSHMPVITIEGEKIWDDFDNKYDSRPKEITIYLYKKDELFMTIVVSSENDWKYVIGNLDKYAGDEEITYTIKEEKVEGYETTIDEFNIINKLIWNEGDGELPPQTGFEIKFGEVLYLIISGVLFKLGLYLKKQIEE